MKEYIYKMNLCFFIKLIQYGKKRIKIGKKLYPLIVINPREYPYTKIANFNQYIHV